MRQARHRLGRDRPRELLASAAWNMHSSMHEPRSAHAARTAAATECILRWCRSACGTPGPRRRDSTEAAMPPLISASLGDQYAGACATNLGWRVGFCVPASKHDCGLVVGTEAAAKGCVRSRQVAIPQARQLTWLPPQARESSPDALACRSTRCGSPSARCCTTRYVSERRLRRRMRQCTAARSSENLTQRTRERHVAHRL